MQLPGILGVLLSGILIGPYGIDMIDESIMMMSGDLRKIALVVILLRAGLGIIMAGLAARSMGVLLALNRTHFTLQERGFCVLAYWPKATVQAAIGAVPLSLGAPHGEFILAVAVLSIIVTAPLGAIAIRLTGDRVLR